MCFAGANERTRPIIRAPERARRNPNTFSARCETIDPKETIFLIVLLWTTAAAALTKIIHFCLIAGTSYLKQRSIWQRVSDRLNRRFGEGRSPVKCYRRWQKFLRHKSNEHVAGAPVVQMQHVSKAGPSGAQSRSNSENSDDHFWLSYPKTKEAEVNENAAKPSFGESGSLHSMHEARELSGAPAQAKIAAIEAAVVGLSSLPSLQ